MHNFSELNRRDILKMGMATVIGSCIPLLSAKDAYASNYGSWRVAFRQPHTNDSFSGVYRVGDKYLPEAFQRLSYVMRDFRTGESFPMDPHLLDIVSLIQKRTNTDKPLHILSGYRSPTTNAQLRKASTGVAKNSFHMYGQAADIRMPGYSTSALRGIAKSLRAGGVGFYPRSNFVHVDTGDVRYW